MKRYFTKKRVIWGTIAIVVLGLIAFAIFKPKDTSKNILTDVVKRQNLRQTVLATGQVVSSTDLKLSFKGSGVVQKINTTVGAQVKAGDILASLDQKDQAASLTSARGSLAAAQANYQKVLSGASSEEVQVAQAAVDSAQTALDNARKSLVDTKKQQQVLVDNALRALLNSTFAAYPKTANLGTAPVIGGGYDGTATGSYVIIFTGGGDGIHYQYSGLESGEAKVFPGTTQLLGTRGLNIQFPTNNYLSDAWEVPVPNTKAANYVSNQNSYNASLESQRVAVNSAENSVNVAQSSLDQAMASLNLKRAQARPADVQAAQAQILSAQGQVATASAALENTVVRAPADGTVTSIDVKVGEQATGLKEVMVLQDVANLHVEANISEANIALVQLGQGVSFTLDALGPERTFKGQVQAVDPASTVVSGVVNYKVTASLEKLPEIKPGMTANMQILVSEKPNVLVVPQRAVLSHDGKKFIRVVTEPKKKTYREQEVSVGLEGDGGVVEVTNGLSEGDPIVTFINK